MVFGKKSKNRDNNISISIEGVSLDVVKHTKFLGIILDSDLNWKQHTIQLSQKLSKAIGILSRARQFLNSTTLRQLYFSFAYPYLNYCSIIWGNAAKCTLWPIFKIQKHAIRIIANLRGRDSTKMAFQKLKLLRLPDIYKFSTILFIYKYKNGLLPPIFDNFYVENSQFHSYQTRAAAQLRIPLTRTKHASMFVKKTGVSLWSQYGNQLSHTIKIGKFKRDLTMLLLSSYSDQPVDTVP